MSKRWRFHVETLAEIEATVEWYDSERPGLGLDFLDELRRSIATLREDPALSTVDATAPAAARVRRRRLARFPFNVVFGETAEEYIIVAVMHLRRRPGYWRSRLDESGA